MARTEKFSLVIPVRNGGGLFLECIRAVLKQSLQPAEILIFDTESTDGAVENAKPLLAKNKPRYFKVLKSEFDHGGTRNAALHAARHPWVLYLTQDAVPADERAFAELLGAAMQKGVVAAYGKQLPHADARPLAATARAFNYGDVRLLQDMAHAPFLGIKTWFASNSFCVWHKQALLKAGGFAEKLILGEDMHAAARLIQAGAAVAYEPRAHVRHSHNYSALEEFRRYFDIGVFHSLHAALLFRAGNANKEGFKFVLGQAAALLRDQSYWSLLKLPFHVAAKFLGYKLGRKYTLLGKRFSRRLSMHKNYWN
ncbi:MAG: glycosyltransferase family 2 protein [Spirochaetes bacterium]|nr:glycosyltransferase family 2 protein [Spirochaetota bacterium]